MKTLRTVWPVAWAAYALHFSTPAWASVYTGGGISAGADEAASIGGISGDNIRTVTNSILSGVLSYMALAATVVIIIAGIYLIVGAGDDNSKERAKKIILYTIAGILLILIARAVVLFLTHL